MMNNIEGNKMVRPINENNTFQRLETEKTSSKKPEEKASQSVAQDTVEISDISKQMANLKTMIDDISELNHARIEFLKQVVKSGDYQVDAQAIAKKLLDDVA